MKIFLWLNSPAWLLTAIVGAVLSLFEGSADAGWFSWGPDPKTEAANQALLRAAQIATEAANIQAQQHGQILEAVTALSNERTNLTQQLTHLTKRTGAIPWQVYPGDRHWSHSWGQVRLSGRCLSADQAGVYSRSEVVGGRVRRVVQAD